MDLTFLRISRIICVLFVHLIAVGVLFVHIIAICVLFVHLLTGSTGFGPKIYLETGAKMEWLPTWLAQRYARLYHRFAENSFDLKAAKEVLADEKFAIRDILRHLEKRGFLYRARMPSDLRRKIYHLIPPEQAVIAFALSQESESPEDKLRAASKDFRYVVNGAAAAYKYHGYMTPAKTDIRIHKKDLGFWIALLKEKGIQIAIDDILAEKRGQVIHLHTNLTEETFARAAKIDRIYYTSAEDLILDFLRHPTDTSLLDALAIMLTCAEDLDWDLLAKSDVAQEVGFAMEALNKEAGKEAFSKKLVKKFAGREVIHKRFSLSAELLDLPEEYHNLAKNWNLEVNIPPRVFQKAASDLVS